MMVLICPSADTTSAQGLHVMFDVNTFAPFTLEMIGHARDELPKVPILTIPNLGTTLTQNNDPHQAGAIYYATNVSSNSCLI